MEDKLKEFARLQQHVREDPTNWQAFFAAGWLWESIMDDMYDKDDYGEYRAIERRITEHQHQGFWTRLRTRITKRGQRT